MDRPEYTALGLFDANLATVEAIRGGADVVYQGTFFDGRFLGFCDFLVRDGDTYAVYDTKLSRHAKVSALLQLAAYAEALADNGIPTSPDVHLLLGDDSDSAHSLGDIVPVYSARRSSLERILDEHRDEQSLAEWGDPRYTACGRCDTCTPEVEQHRDLLLVAGMRTTQRSRLIAAGIGTLDALAAHAGSVEGLPERTLESLRAQAALQLRQESSGTPEFQVYAPQAAGRATRTRRRRHLLRLRGRPALGRERIHGLGPRIPLRRGRGSRRRRRVPAVLGTRPRRGAAGARRLPRLRRRAPCSSTRHAHLPLRAVREVGAAAAGRTARRRRGDRRHLLRDGVLVDLYPIVRGCLRIGERSYSIKKLEPLYMGGAAARRRRHQCRRLGRRVRRVLRSPRRRPGRRGTRSCCRASPTTTSTTASPRCGCATGCSGGPRDARRRALRPPGDGPTPVDRGAAPPAEAALREFAGHGPSSTGGTTSRRPRSWPLRSATTAASGSRSGGRTSTGWSCRIDELVGHPRRSGGRRPRSSRRLAQEQPAAAQARAGTCSSPAVSGTGSTVGPETTMYALYDIPAPEAVAGDNPQQRGTCTVNVLDVGKDGRTPRRGDRRGTPATARSTCRLPMALDPRSPDHDRPHRIVHRGGRGRRCAPRCRSFRCARRSTFCGGPTRAPGAANPLPPVDGTDYAGAITAALLDLDDSYVAVQGPPGTGKTYTGARVIKALVEQHQLADRRGRTVACGGREHARRRREGRARPPNWSRRRTGGTRRDVDRHQLQRLPRFPRPGRDTGCVIGGTAWDFANTDRVPPGSLDLLVIDEAGQFSLANTIAVAARPRNLLLLGDPQQLPQVSQGTHREPVDESALGWLAEGHGALPASRGYFLERTWRMHPELCAPGLDAVLRWQAAFAGIRQCRTATRRARAGCAHRLRRPPAATPPNPWRNRREVVDRIASCSVRDGPTRASSRAPGHSTQSDILVVAPYNAQVGADRARSRPRRVSTRSGRHGRQVPGAGGAGRHRVDDRVGARGRAARHVVPAVAQPDERRGVPRQVGGDHRPVGIVDAVHAEHAGRSDRAGCLHAAHRSAEALTFAAVGGHHGAGAVRLDEVHLGEPLAQLAGLRVPEPHPVADREIPLPPFRSPGSGPRRRPRCAVASAAGATPAWARDCPRRDRRRCSRRRTAS